MFKGFSIIFLAICLSGCTVVAGDRSEVQIAVSEVFDAGFEAGLYCIEKGHTVEKCKEILKRVQKERGE